MAPHLRFAERATRKLSREIFHGMLVHKAKLQRKQAFLFRTVDVAMEIFAMAASISRVRTMREENHPRATEAAQLADLFCRSARRRIRRLFRDLWNNDDVVRYGVGTKVLKGDHVCLEVDTMGALPTDRRRPGTKSAPGPTRSGSEPVYALPSEREGGDERNSIGRRQVLKVLSVAGVGSAVFGRALSAMAADAPSHRGDDPAGGVDQRNHDHTDDQRKLMLEGLNQTDAEFAKMRAVRRCRTPCPRRSPSSIRRS